MKIICLFTDTSALPFFKGILQKELVSDRILIPEICIRLDQKKDRILLSQASVRFKFCNLEKSSFLYTHFPLGFFNVRFGIFF